MNDNIKQHPELSANKPELRLGWYYWPQTGLSCANIKIRWLLAPLLWYFWYLWTERKMFF